MEESKLEDNEIGKKFQLKNIRHTKSVPKGIVRSKTGRLHKIHRNQKEENSNYYVNLYHLPNINNSVLISWWHQLFLQILINIQKFNIKTEIS